VLHLGDDEFHDLSNESSNRKDAEDAEAKQNEEKQNWVKSGVTHREPLAPQICQGGSFANECL
jgi:hypothetical protein